MLKQVLVLFFLVAAVLAEKAYFVVETEVDRDRPLIIELVRDADIKHARDLINGETTDKPHIMGRIKKTKAFYNPDFDYHIDPDTISFFNHAIEVCDASFSYIEDHLDEACGALLPGCYFCPWTSRLVGEMNWPHENQRSFRVQYWSEKQGCH